MKSTLAKNFFSHTGARQREDIPGTQFADGTNVWYRDGKPFRVDHPDGSKEWFCEGNRAWSFAEARQGVATAAPAQTPGSLIFKL